MAEVEADEGDEGEPDRDQKVGRYDRLDSLMGRVVRHHVMVETMCQNVWKALATPGWTTSAKVPRGLAPALPMPGLDRLVDQCRIMTTAALPEQLPDEWRAAILDLLAEARRLNERRNAALHDSWIPAYDADGRIDTNIWKRHSIGKFKVTPGTLAELEDLAASLDRLHFRLGELIRPLVTLMDMAGTPHIGYLRMVQGRFEVLPDGTRRPDLS
jgi:hypothetical protein